MATGDITAREVFEQFGGSAISDIQAKLGSTGANASGKTSRSLRKELADDELTIFGSEVFRYVEEGRGPSKKKGSGSEDLYSQIKQWIKDKGITPTGDISDDNLAFLITRKIHNEGTLLHRTKTARDIFSSVLNKNRIESLVKVIADNTRNKITSDIVKAFK